MASDRLDSFGDTGDMRDSVYDARTALQEMDSARARFGHQLATPWWYKLVSAMIVAVLFVGAGMPYERLSFGSSRTGALLVVVTVVIGPLWLRELLKRSTGATFDRYSNGWTVASMALIGMLVLCVSLQAFADLEFAPLFGAGVGFAFTYLYEQRIDHRLARGQFPARPPEAGREHQAPV